MPLHTHLTVSSVPLRLIFTILIQEEKEKILRISSRKRVKKRERKNVAQDYCSGLLGLHLCVGLVSEVFLSKGMCFHSDY